MTRIKPTNEAWKDCPRAEECSVNDCPLTKIRYKSYSCDPQNKCTFGKTGRKRIGNKWGLKNFGLTGRELAGKKKWDSLPEEVKEARIGKLKKKSPIARLSAKGYMIAPKKKIMCETHRQIEQIGLKQCVDDECESGSEVKNE